MAVPVFRGVAGEVLRQASAVVGRPVMLWEVSGPDEIVARATSERASGARPAAVPQFDLATLRRWKVPIPVGSRWVTARLGPEGSGGSWVIAPVRSQPPAPPPDGRERRSRERLALELAGLALGLIERESSADPLQELASLPAMIAHEASNPLTAARAGLQMAMETVGRWVDLGADRRLSLLDDLGQVIEDIDRAADFLRAVQDRTRGVTARSERFDAVRVVRSCLTLERRLLRDRGLGLDFATTVESSYLSGDPNALFDVLMNLVRNAGDASASGRTPVEVRVTQDARHLELVVRDRGKGLFEPGSMSNERLAKVRTVVEGAFRGTVRTDSTPGGGSTVTVLLPLIPQRGS